MSICHFFLLKRCSFLFYVCHYFACMYACEPRMCSTQGGQKRTLEVELQTVVSCYVGVGNLTWVFWNSRQFSSGLIHFYSPHLPFLKKKWFLLYVFYFSQLMGNRRLTFPKVKRWETLFQSLYQFIKYKSSFCAWRFCTEICILSYLSVHFLIL